MNESSIPQVHPESSSKKTKKSHQFEHELEQQSKERLVELLRSTPEYRSFVFYYDSNELSYLKRLQIQHRKNCTKTLGDKEKLFWAPKTLVK